MGPGGVGPGQEVHGLFSTAQMRQWGRQGYGERVALIRRGGGHEDLVRLDRVDLEDMLAYPAPPPLITPAPASSRSPLAVPVCFSPAPQSSEERRGGDGVVVVVVVVAAAVVVVGRGRCG